MFHSACVVQVLVQASVKNITERHASLLLEDVTLMPEDGLHSTKVTRHPHIHAATAISLHGSLRRVYSEGVLVLTQCVIVILWTRAGGGWWGW